MERLLQYPQHTAGGIMTTEFVRLDPRMTVGEALKHIRSVAREKESIYACYVLEPGTGRLLGSVSLRDLVMAEMSAAVTDVMRKKPVTVAALDDQEAVAKKIAKYNLLAVPVLEKDGSVVGFVTVDDVIDVIIEEQTEDVLKMAGHRGRRPRQALLREPDPARGAQADRLAAPAVRGRDLHGHRAAPLRGRAGGGGGPLVLHPAPDRHRRQRRLPDRDDDHPQPGPGRDPLKDAWRVLAREATTGLTIGLLIGGRWPSAARCMWGAHMPLAWTVAITVLVDLHLVHDRGLGDPAGGRALRRRLGRPLGAPDHDPRGRHRPHHLLPDRQGRPRPLTASVIGDTANRSAELD